jgi:hypothetical protein
MIEIPGEISAASAAILNALLLGRDDAELLATDIFNARAGENVFVLVARGSAREVVKSKLYDDDPEPEVEAVEDSVADDDPIRKLVNVTTGVKDTSDARAASIDPRPRVPAVDPMASVLPPGYVGGDKPLVPVVEGVRGMGAGLPSDGIS